MPLSLPRDCDSLAAEIGGHEIALLIVGPLIPVVDARINVNQDRDLRGALEPLARLAGLASGNGASRAPDRAGGAE